MKKFLVGLLITALSSLTFVAVNPANAAAGDSISLYFSAPFVQGSHLTGSGVPGSGVYTESFNGMSAGACASPTAIGSLAAGSSCNVQANPGNTAVPNGEPSIGGTFTNYANGLTSGATFEFTNTVKYVGMWWMMGSAGNTVEFYDSSNSVIATLTSSDIMSFLGVSYGSLTNSDTGTLNTVAGGTHPRRHYFRTPYNYTGTVASPVMNYNVDNYANEPWVYLNLYVAGSIGVTKMRLSGSNFEVDNITISENVSTPRGDMVLVRSILGTAPDTQTIAWAPTNTTADISSGALTPDVAAAVTSPVTGGGAISYSVVSAGTSGCTVNSSTGVITATAAGTCVVKATAAAVNGTPSYYSASTNSTFTFTANAPAPVASAPYVPPVPAEITSVVLTRGASSTKSNIKVQIKEPGSNSFTTDVKVKLVDFGGKVIREIVIPVESTTETVEFGVDVPYGDFNVEAVALNRYMTSQSVYSSADLVQKNFFESKAANRAPSLAGSAIGKPVYFAANSAKLSAAAKKSLASLAEHLKKSDSRVALTGFASKWIKSAKFERDLATKRSYAVGAYLKSLGVTNWVYYAGYGALTSVDTLPSARKVELRVVD